MEKRGKEGKVMGRNGLSKGKRREKEQEMRGKGQKRKMREK